MNAEYPALDIEQRVQGARIDVGETAHCETCDARMHEGQPVTVLARRRSDGRWDIEQVFGPWCAPEDLSEHRRRDGEAVALVEGELAVVLSDQQSWLMLVRPDVLDWIDAEN